MVSFKRRSSKGASLVSVYRLETGLMQNAPSASLNPELWMLSSSRIQRHLQQAVNSVQECATRNGFRFAAHKCKVIHFTAPRVRIQRPPTVRIGNTPLPVEESTKFLGLWWDSHFSFKKHISVLKAQCKEALNLIGVVAHLKWGGDRDTLLMLYRAIVRSKLDYGCIVCGTALNAYLRQLDSIHNSGLRLALGSFCTSPVSSQGRNLLVGPSVGFRR